MAIAPVSDLVMDVVNAADPSAVSAARAKLAQGAPAAGEASFETVAASAPLPRVEQAALEPYQRFEAMVLGSFIEAMLPKDAESAYGGGMAGGMWKGLLAEKLGTELARNGGIGIADRLIGDHYVENDKKIPLGPRAEAPSQTGAGETMLKETLVAELQRRALGPIIGTGASRAEPR